jgi:CO/xanthine dehydrogenase Mo-binding subunit
VLVSSAEFGQGTNTVLCQIAAEALGLPYENVTIAQPDTTVVPNSGPTVASRTAMIVGKLVQSAAKGIKETLAKTNLLADDYTPEQFHAACREYIAAHGALKSYARYESRGSIRSFFVGGVRRGSYGGSCDLPRIG